MAVTLAAGAAEAQQSPIVPGRMGPNALPAIPVEDAALPARATAEMAAGAALGGRGLADRAFTPQFQLVVPFLDAAAIEVSGRPLEVWSVTPETRERVRGRALSGVAKGDVWFGGRFALKREGAWPALTLRLLTKSTTGKALADARFTDGPGYAIEALASRTVLARSAGPVRAVRVHAKLGFLAWTQETPGLQDDALDYGLAVDTVLRAGTELRVEWRGYQGYQSQDKPMLASFRVLQPVSRRASLLFGVNRGIRSDAPDWEVRAGVALGLRSPFGG